MGLEVATMTSVTGISITETSTMAKIKTMTGRKKWGTVGEHLLTMTGQKEWLSVGEWGNGGWDASVSASIVEVHGSGVLLDVSAGLVGLLKMCVKTSSFN